ncbi:helix-turn-helix transcriptional regulator [Bosea thiooxidans]|nr:helix-turn-helix transcriptional regulator [Bosea sp. (in: a-proteobacteria)]
MKTAPRRSLKVATDHIAEHAACRIRLRDLAELVGLSQSHFSHAFKASTGLPPRQWQPKVRARPAPACNR